MVLYLIYHKGFRAIKIGISDISGKRYAKHRQNGWILIKYWYFFERDKARQIESIVLTILRNKYGVFLTKADMPNGGYTETFDADKVSRKSVIRMINKTIKECL